MLDQWLESNRSIQAIPILSGVAKVIENAFASQFSGAALVDLHATLGAFVGGRNVGESLPTTLPLDDPPPGVTFFGKSFCLTGKFDFGTRRQCEEAIRKRGGDAGPMRTSTNYLVIGNHVNEGWVHSSYGTKIIKAAEWQKDHSISIISEAHWSAYLT